MIEIKWPELVIVMFCALLIFTLFVVDINEDSREYQTIEMSSNNVTVSQSDPVVIGRPLTITREPKITKIIQNNT